MVIDEIRKELYGLADEEKARHHQRFFRTGPGEYGEGDAFLGIRVPDVRKVAARFKDVSLGECLELLKSNYHEERQLALFFLVRLYSKGTGKDKKEIYDSYLGNTRYINNWDLVDGSAPNIVGAHLFDRPRKPLYRLAKSESLWERRIAILSTFYFIRNGQYDDALEISRALLKDREDLIHKAAGWMLREVGNRDRAVEESFLREHASAMPRTMLRYAIEKFPEAKRLRYLNGTKG